MQLCSDKKIKYIYIYLNKIIITLYIFYLFFLVEIYMLTIYIYLQLITSIKPCSHALLFQQDHRLRSASEPVKSSETKVEDEPDDRRSAPELMLTYLSPYSHYDYPRKLSEPPIPVALKVLHIYTHNFFNIQHRHKCSSYWKSETQTSIWQNPVNEDADEKDEMQDESAEDSSEYMAMASLYVFESFSP